MWGGNDVCVVLVYEILKVKIKQMLKGVLRNPSDRVS